MSWQQELCDKMNDGLTGPLLTGDKLSELIKSALAVAMPSAEYNPGCDCDYCKAIHRLKKAALALYAPGRDDD